MDARGRVNISTFKPRGDLFMVQCHDDGTIVLVPATVMPAQQAHELMALRQSAMTAAPAVTDPPADSLPTVDPRMAAGLSVDLSQP